MDPAADLFCGSRKRWHFAIGRLIVGPVWKPRAAARKFLPGGTFTLLICGLAHADPAPPTASHTEPSFSVEVERDDSAQTCPEQDWFRARIASHAGQAGQAGDFRVTLTRHSDAWQARIERWEQSSSAPAAARVLRDRSSACQPLAEAVAVTIAILADDVAKHAEPEVAPQPAAVEQPAKDVAPDKPAPSADSGSKVWVGAGGGGTMAFISPLAPLLGFGIGLDSLRLRQSLRVMLTTEQKFELAPGRVVVQAWLATVLSCLRFKQDHLGAALCGVVDVAMLRASAEGFAEGTPSTRAYGAAGLEVQPSWYVSDSYRISAALAALVPFTQESFSVTGKGVAYIPPKVSWRVLLLSEIGAF